MPAQSWRWPFWRLEWFLGPMLILRTHDADSRDFGVDCTDEVKTHLVITAELCGVSTRTVSRWKAVGLTDCWSDRVAIRLGVHPCVIWGRAWLDRAMEEAA